MASPNHIDSRRGSSQDSGTKTAFDSSTFDKDVQIKVNETVGSASISPSGRDVVLASREGLHIIDLDSPFSPPRYVAHRSPWEVADVQWSPFASRDSWIVSTSNQKALVWNLNLQSSSASGGAPIEHTLHAHSNAITDINFSAHNPDVLATCAVDSYVHCWDLRRPSKPVISFAEWFSGATQVKWNRQDEHIIASSHQRKLCIWDDRKGAYPLKEIEAHSTQIYGVDWSRVRPEAVLTCSLDRTIKLWDYTSEDSVPERVIRTPYPVWRARHTPFGWGILAMPKRHDFNLHMYDRRKDTKTTSQKDLPPVHSFAGHTDQVKEFLWRSRGGIHDGADNREFQLVSWGTDRVLRLHKVEDRHFEAVGHNRGAEVHKRLNLTRAGATYRTYRDETPKTDLIGLPKGLKPPRTSGLLGWSLTQSAMGKSAALNTMAAAAPAGMQARRRAKKEANAIDWMGGVKMGKAAEGGLLGLGPRPSIRPDENQVIWDTPDSLSDEITYVGKKFKKVTFEHVDVNKRLTTVTLNGPWGVDGASVFVRMTLRFPSAYPVHATPQCIFEKTTSAVTDDAMARIKHGLRTISEYFGMRRIGSLEAIMLYILGERNLDESLKAISDPTVAEDSSSDDEDEEDDTSRLDMSGSLGSAIANANVPLPKECGAYFAEDGRLVCFFPPKPEPKPLFDLAPLRSEDKPKGWRLFDDFGRWRTDSPEPKEVPSEGDIDDTEDEGTSSGAPSSSSTSSDSDFESESYRLTGRFKPPSAWRGATLRLTKTSRNSSSAHLPQSKTSSAPPAPPPPKSYVHIVDTRDLVPARKNLAEDYLVFGDGPSVCAHNAHVARHFGLEETAQMWELIQMILYNKVPLQILPHGYSKDPILTVARRALAFRKKQDSALDLTADELHGRVKWGGHPLAGKWLIPKLFEHFERLADTQMLAMMACVLAEPAVRQPVAETLYRLKQRDPTMAMQCPGFSLDYAATEDMAWSALHAQSDPISITKQGLPTFAFSEDGSRRYGSAESSTGVWGSSNSDPRTPYSAQSTPPKFVRSSSMRLNFPQSLSTSPEKALALRRASTNPFASALALPRPDVRTAPGTPPEVRFNDDEADLSTSAPASAVTWGSTTVFNTGSASPVSQRKSLGSVVDVSFDGLTSRADSSDEDLSSDDDDAFDARSFVSRRSSVPAYHPANSPNGTVDVTIKLTLNNQDQFDDEACAHVPLLDPDQSGRHASYRAQYAEQLAVWGLAVQHSEVLKFNGLVAKTASSSAIGVPWSHSRQSSGGTYNSMKGPYDGHGKFQRAVGKTERKESGEERHCRICWETVTGLYSLCEECGVGRAHQTCADEWAQELGESEGWCCGQV